ncbi:hypothetical protein HZ994_02025 [Akkermansiaceae bacterium]|nr:hypothetical protein HZ994_02025 [Akkermansiaceae bacterium]
MNAVETAGVIEGYAIGGAVGATFHLEPVSTLDVDIFDSFKQESGSLLISPQAIFDYLASLGCMMEGEGQGEVAPVHRGGSAGRGRFPGHLGSAPERRGMAILHPAFPFRFPMTFDLHRIIESKRAHRRGLASRGIMEKLAMLDAMRERAVALRSAVPADTEGPDSSVLREDSPPYRTSSRTEPRYSPSHPAHPEFPFPSPVRRLT